MSNRNQKRSKKNQNINSSEDRTRLFFVRAIAVWIFVLPLIVHFKIVDVPVQMQDLYLREQAVDLFTYWKAVWLWIGAGVFFISALVFRHIYKIGYKPTKQIWALLAFAITVMISFLFSDAKNVAWFGYLDRYEGTLSWLSYCMIAYSVHTFTSKKEHGLTIIKGIVFSAGIVGLIGTFQYFGLDFFKTDIAKHLMLGTKYDQYASQLNFTMPVGQSYSTLYNPNYIGSFVSITLPLVAYMMEEAKNYRQQTQYAIIVILLLISLVGSKSTVGFVAVLVLFVISILIIIIKLKVKTKKKITLLIIGTFTLVVLLLMPYTQIQLKKILNQFDKNQISNYFESVDVVDKSVVIKLQNEQNYTISPKGNIIEVKDSTGNILKGEYRENSYLVKTPDAPHSYVILEYKNRYVKFVYFADYEKKLYSTVIFDYFSELGEFSFLKRSLSKNNNEYYNFFENETILSKRGYIWNRTIPMILKSPIIGYGSDTFALHFPQVDLLNKLNIMRSHRIIVDKVHNTFFQIALNFGVIGLLIFIYIIFVKSLNSWHILFMVIGYLITSIINDPIVSTTSLVMIVMHIEKCTNIID